MILFIFINFWLLISIVFALRTFTWPARSLKAVVAGLLFFAQIILTSVALGFSHQLYLHNLLAINFFISLMFLYVGKSSLASGSGLSIDKAYWKEILTLPFKGMNLSLTVLFVFLMIWLTISAWLLPVRVCDDLTYHIPLVLQAVQDGGLNLLPIQIQLPYAFPLNAEMLFLWPTIFFHNTVWIDYVQVVVAVYGLIVIYALMRLMNVKREDAYFVALCTFFTPVALFQLGSGYIDVTTSVFLMTELTLAYAFYQTQKIHFAYFAALSAGLLVGMKYSMPPFALLGLAMLLFRAKGLKKHWLSLFSIFLIPGMIWYLRNSLVFGNMAYGTDNCSNLGFTDLSKKFLLLFTRDIGIGTFEGGFGLFFWGMCFPSWIYIFFKSLVDWRQAKALVLLMSFVLAGFVMLMFIPLQFFSLSPRYIIFVVYLSAVCFALILQEHSSRAKGLRGLAVGMCFLSMTLLAMRFSTTYRIEKPLEDLKKGKYGSEYKYWAYSGYIKPIMRYVAEPLDLLTKDGRGLNVYMVSNHGAFWLTHLYGSQLQNRVLNVSSDTSIKPDIYIDQSLLGEDKVYYPYKLTVDDIIKSGDYVLISSFVAQVKQGPAFSSMFIRKELLKDGVRRERLLNFYRSIDINDPNFRTDWTGAL